MYTLAKAALQIEDNERKWQHPLNQDFERLYQRYGKEIASIAFARRDLHVQQVEERQADLKRRRQDFVYVPLRPSVQLAKGNLVLRWVFNGARKVLKKNGAEVEELTTKYSRTITWRRSGPYEKMRPSDWVIPEKRFGKSKTSLDEDLVKETEEIFGQCRAAWTAMVRHRLAHQAPALRFEALLAWQTEEMEKLIF